MSNQEINNLLNKIEVNIDWQPSHELMVAVFNAAVKGMLAENERWYRREESATFPMILSPNVLTWFWSLANDKQVYLGRLFDLYAYRSYGGPFEKGIPQSVKEEIQSIIFKAWDVLPEDSTSEDIQSLRIRISQTFPEKEINFTEKLLQASISGDKQLFEFWSRNGREVSTDPDFYSMIWSKIERSKGYTDQRGYVIEAAKKCKTFPEQIINDLTSGGHNKNKASVVNVAVGHIGDLRKRIARNKSLESALSPEMEYWQSVLARFVSCDDYYVIQRMIPAMRRQDLIFLAPAAAAAGLGSLIEKYMNPEAYPDFHKDQAYRYNYGY